LGESTEEAEKENKFFAKYVKMRKKLEILKIEEILR